MEVLLKNYRTITKKDKRLNEKMRKQNNDRISSRDEYQLSFEKSFVKCL